MNFNTISTRVCPPLDFLTFLRPCEYLKRDAYFMCFTLQSCPEDVQCQNGYIWDHPFKTSAFLPNLPTDNAHYQLMTEAPPKIQWLIWNLCILMHHFSRILRLDLSSVLSTALNSLVAGLTSCISAITQNMVDQKC